MKGKLTAPHLDSGTPTDTPTPTETPTDTAVPVPSDTPTASATVSPSQTPTAPATQIATPTATAVPSGPVTINYAYDPLYRLTTADYSTGDYYHYTYDAVGNRLTQDESVYGLASTDTYIYDDANRLTSASGVNYAWDSNGNLLSDGVNTYTYDSTNRLIAINGQSAALTGAIEHRGNQLQRAHHG